MTGAEGRYFGRKRGKSFQRLERFKHLLFDPSKKFFENFKEEINLLEIGIGDGIKIAKDAHKNPKINFVGCDIFIDGVLRAARYKHENNLNNLFVFHLNVQNLIPYFNKNFFDNIRIYFPDPWPKNRHKRRRTFNKDLLDQITPKMKIKSSIDFATDHADYFLDAMILVSKFGFIPVSNTPNMWQYSLLNAIGTKYEKKALDKNNKLFYFSVLKK